MQSASSAIRRVAAGAACGWLALAAAAAGQPFDVEVSHRARGVQPGEVVLVSVSSPEGLASVEGTIFDRTVHFHHTEPGSWRGLVGIGRGRVVFGVEVFRRQIGRNRRHWRAGRRD